jgi:hypothetical protein
MAATGEIKQFSIAIAVANKHPSSEDWAATVVSAFDAQQAPAPTVTTDPVAVADMPATEKIAQ